MSESNKKKYQKETAGIIEEHIKRYSEDEIIEEIIEEEEKEAPDKEHEKKLEQLKEAIEKVEKERDAFRDNYQRTFSEFNNFKKRNQLSASHAMKEGMGDAITKILPVIDNLERALDHVDSDENSAFVQGISMVYKQLIDILESMEVTEIPAEGNPFDPTVHQAIQQVEPEEGIEPDMIVAVAQKGYMMSDKILRHSMVVVSK